MMSLQNRPLNSKLRHTSFGSAQSFNGPSPMLVTRIKEKKAELENLKQLRDLSGGLAAQMQALEEKLSTLSDGTQAVATVLSNWHNVMRAINMASVKLPKPAASEGDESADKQQKEIDAPLPQTLVRIPVETEENGEKSNDSGEDG